MRVRNFLPFLFACVQGRSGPSSRVRMGCRLPEPFLSYPISTHCFRPCRTLSLPIVFGRAAARTGAPLGELEEAAPRTCTPRASCTGTADFAESWKSDLSPRRPQIHAFFFRVVGGPGPFPPLLYLYPLFLGCSVPLEGGPPHLFSEPLILTVGAFERV